MDAGFVHVVEMGQYSLTKDTGDFTQFHTVVCREYTLSRDDGSSQPRGWIQGNTRIGPVLEVMTFICTLKMELKLDYGFWLWIHPLRCDDPSILGRVYSRQAIA